MTNVTSKQFGTMKDGEQATLYIMTNKSGCKVSVCNYGATLVSVKVPDRMGNFADIVLGYDDVKGYETENNYFGATVGRCCNRIGKARFELNGKTYNLEKNDGNNHLHGGPNDFARAKFQTLIRKNDNSQYLSFHYISPDGEQNYPGNLDVTVSYTLTDTNELIIHYTAVSDADTVCNITNHSYFNLSGHDSGDILSQEVRIYADYFTPSDKESIPTGEIKSVMGTPMDFREFHKVGERIDADFDQLKNAGGYDHNFVINKGKERLSPCAEMYDEKSGRHITFLTTTPCAQFYTGNYVSPQQTAGKCGAVYPRRAGMCMETQYAPDAVNQPNFTSTVLKAGKTFDETTVIKFDIK